jgi:hypothetical protein
MPSHLRSGAERPQVAIGGMPPVSSGPYPHRSTARQPGSGLGPFQPGHPANRCTRIFGDTRESVKDFVSHPLCNLVVVLCGLDLDGVLCDLGPPVAARIARRFGVATHPSA